MSRTVPLALSPSVRREAAFIAAATAIGAVLRIWAMGRLGLVHFDEGVYAMSGLWAIGPRGLAGLDPMVIPYAPPGFPILVGLAYRIFGASDLAAILVSAAAGALTIPAAAMLARRTFGPGAGAAAAGLTALSGFHVAFSRMALTDATFLLAWLVGLIVAQRFVERPGAATGVALGVSVGLAQLVKYSGWTLGAVVPLSLIALALRDPSRRVVAYQGRAWGFGLLAAATAALVYAPWFAFVESHGGYRGLMAHHSGYVGPLDAWFGHWRVQLAQESALAGGLAWNALGWLAAIAGAIVGRPDASGWKRSWGGGALIALIIVGTLAPTLLWWIGLGWLAFPNRGASPGTVLLGVAWLGLSILTPFYHPYARLWLPVHSLGWIAAAGAIAALVEGRGGSLEGGGRRRAFAIACGLAALAQGLVLTPTPSPGERGTGLLAPGDSLRIAVGRALADLPRTNPGLRLLARPPVTFYIGGRAEASVEPDLERLVQGSDVRPGAWALVDLAQLRQSGDVASASERLLERWEKVGAYSTALNLPTLLDVDPSAAFTARPGEAEAPLWLLRPRGRGGERSP